MIPMRVALYARYSSDLQRDASIEDQMMVCPARADRADRAFAGVSGDTTEQMLARLDSAVPAGTKVVIFQAGGNDARNINAASSTQANIREITCRLRARGIHLVPAGPGIQASPAANSIALRIRPRTILFHDVISAGVPKPAMAP